MNSKQIKFSEEKENKLKELYHSFSRWWINDIWYQYAPKFIRFVYMDCREFYYDHIRCHLAPQNKWAMKAIPKTFKDKTSAIPDVLFAAIVDFVEVEKCFEATEWYKDDLNPQMAVIADKIKEIYRYAKVSRPELQKRQEESYPKPITDKFFHEKEHKDGGFIMLTCEERYGMSFEEAYKQVNDFEKEIKMLDDKYLHMILDIREYLWV